jgi:para-aminobenzoate synthetase/4-amino-4-deoxychorismate lyase
MNNSNFSLLETMLYEPEHGILLLDQHLERLNRAIIHFQRKYPSYFVCQPDIHQLQRQLDTAIKEKVNHHQSARVIIMILF